MKQLRIQDQFLLTEALRGVAHTAHCNPVIIMKNGRMISHLQFSLKWGKTQLKSITNNNS